MREIFKVVIEIPKGNMNNKYEYDESTGEFKLDFVFENLVWPYNYGFLPGTKAGDGDTLDAIVLSSAPLKQGQEVECKIIGMIEVLDRGVEDNKIICVPAAKAVSGVESAEDPSSTMLTSTMLNDIIDISQQQKQEWSEFLMELARQKKKITKIKGFKTKKQALELIKKSLI